MTLPRTQHAVPPTLGRGYDMHHVVERWAARDGVPPSIIFSPENEVPIPKLKHWQINRWFDTPSEEFKDIDGNEMTPRQYLRGKSWEERRRVGIEALIRFGVLKP
jgi:hypothetical protein